MKQVWKWLVRGLIGAAAVGIVLAALVASFAYYAPPKMTFVEFCTRLWNGDPLLDEDEPIGEGTEVPESRLLLTEDLNCLPASFFADSDEEFRRDLLRRFSYFLSVFKEPSLYKKSKDKSQHCYRFIWSRTFHRPVTVRLEHREGQRPILIAKRSTGAGGYDPGSLELDREVDVSAWRFSWLAKEVEASGFWNMPNRMGGYGLDGSTWTLEGVRDGKYHIVGYFCPERGIPFRNVCVRLLELGGVKRGPMY